MKRIEDIIPYINKFDQIEDLVDYISNEIARYQKGDFNLQSIKGNVFESIVQIIIFTKNSIFEKVDYYGGNINTNNIIKITDFFKILKNNIQSSNESGYSDIHFKKDDQWYISTSKYFKNNNKKLSDYDLTKLDAIILNNNNLKNAKYLVFVANKKHFVDTFKSANKSSKGFYSKRLDIENNVFGIDEIQKWYESLRILLLENEFDLKKIKKYLDTDREILHPLYHQKLGITWLLNIIYNYGINKKTSKILLDVFQGQGKTYIIAGMIIENIKKRRNWNYVLTSHRPILFSQWMKPFQKYFGLEDINVIDYLKDRQKYTDKEWEEMINGGNNFIMISVQACNNIENEKYSDIRNINFDIEIRDESHEGFETFLSLENLKNIKSNIKIFLSGTPQKNIFYQMVSGYFDKKFSWNLIDWLTIIKTGFHNGIKVDDRSMDWYKSIPLLNYYIEEWSNEFMDKLHNKGFPKKDYPTPQKVFKIDDKNNKFFYENEIEWWIENVVCNPLMKTGWLFDNNYIKGTTIITLDNKEQQKHLKKIIDRVINNNDRKFDIHIVNSDVYKSSELKNIKNLSYGIEGRILLIVDQLRVGSNIEGRSTKDFYDDLDAHTIIKLDSKKSYGINFQTDGRLLRKYNGIFGKKERVRVIDPWVYRGYSVYYEIIESQIKNENKKDKDKALEIMRNYIPIWHNGSILNNTNEEYYEMLSRYLHDDFYNNDLHSYRLNNMYDLSKSIENLEILRQIPSGGDVNIKMDIEDGIGDKDKKGKTSERTKSIEKKEKSIDEKEIREHMITFYNSLFYLVFLSEFKFKNIKNILNNLSEFIYINKVSYTKKDFYEKFILGCDISIIKELLGKEVIKEEIVNNYINDFINNYKKTDDDKLTIIERLKNIYDLINEYRYISSIEKKKYGEVFTPFELIEEMLDTLPTDVWTNPKLKWLDPANGVGNFPIIVVIRLMKGLKDVIEDDEERYRHIIENMIYTCDIQPKNNFIFTQLFGGFDNKKYKLNLYGGSFLEEGFDKHMNEVWGLDGFNLVIGNPPYNYNKDNTIYEKFSIKSFKVVRDNNYVLFLTKKAIFSKFFDNKELCKYNVDKLKLNVDYTDLDLSVAYFLGVKKERENVNIIDNILNKTLDGKKTYYPSKSTINIDLNDRENGKYNVILKNTEKDIIYSTSKEKHKDHDNIKLIMTLLNGRGYTERGKFRYIIDDGNLSVGSRKNSAFLFYVKLDSIQECKSLVKYLESKLVRYIIKKLDLIRLPYYDVLKFIKPIDLSKSWTDNELYKYFNLSTEEIELIENTIK